MPKQEAPKPGTYRAIVLESINKGWLTPTIVEQTPLTHAQVERGLRGNKESGYDIRTPQEREEARRAAIRLSRNSILPDIGIYIGMRMAAIEIHEAESITGKAPHNIRNIRWTARHARERGYKGMKKFTEEEVANVRRSTSYQRRSSIRERAGLWLDAAAIVFSTNTNVPATRMEWMRLIEKYKNAGRISAEAHRWQALLGGYAKSNRQLLPDWSDIIEQKRQRNEARGNKMQNVWAREGYREKLKKGEIDPKVYPLALRRFPDWDITMITGYTQKQVDNVVTKRKLKGELGKVSNEERSRRHRKAKVGRKIHEKRVATAHEVHTFQIVGAFQEAGFITEDLSGWEDLHSLYSQYGRSMPEEPGERTILEMYLRALKAHVAMKDQFVQVWREIERAADPDVLQPLAQEKLFIKIKLLSPWADGEDTTGLYTVKGETRIYQRVVHDGGFVHDTSELALQRTRMRFSQSSGK